MTQIEKICLPMHAHGTDVCKCQSTYGNMKQMEDPAQNLSTTSNFCETDILLQQH